MGPSRLGLHWGWIVSLLYLALLAVLTIPFILAAFAPEVKWGAEVFRVYREPYYWIFLVVLGVSQWALLRVPVRVAARRPVSRRSIWLPTLVSGFWFACLVLGAGAALLIASKLDYRGLPWLVLGAAIGSWIVWAFIFLRLTRAQAPEAVVLHQARGLLKGSIAELLVAVPSHIIVRHRHDCCADVFTFFGITMGLSVMLLSFGPGVFLLYAARFQRLRAARPSGC
jgi:hypothetical protein